MDYFDDQEGQRTGVATAYQSVAFGVQHWLSPQIEMRPEVAWYRAGKDAFNGNSNHGIAPDKQEEVILTGDVIVHF